MDKQLQAVADSQGNLSATANLLKSTYERMRHAAFALSILQVSAGDQRDSTGTKLSALVESPVPLYFERTGYG